jgi:hypothetical protein
VSNQSAAYLHIEMERARAELEEHRAACISAANEAARSTGPGQQRSEQREESRTGFVPTAA